jgi:hypothetical protein
VASLQKCAQTAGLEIFGVFWDSSPIEIIASEQIAKGIAWREPESWASTASNSVFDEQLAARWEQVEELNRAGDAGRAGFYMRPRRQ